MDSAADKAGIKAGDVIVRVDDAKVATPADISAHLRALRGRSVSVVVVRDRKEITVMLAAICRPDRSTRPDAGSGYTPLQIGLGPREPATVWPCKPAAAGWLAP